MPTGRRRPRPGARAFAAIAVLGVVAGATVAGGPAQAAARKIVGYGVSTEATRVTTSTGKQLDLSLGTNFTRPSCTGCLDGGSFATVVLSDPNAHEAHEWDGFGDAADFTAPTSTSPGTADSGDLLSTSGTFTLSFTPTGSPTYLKCDGRIGARIQKVTVSGTLSFATRSKGENAWGVVGTSASPLAFSTTGMLETDYTRNCAFAITDGDAGPRIPTTCGALTNWEVENGNRFALGTGRKTNAPFTVSRAVELPNGLLREDDYSGRLASAKVTRSPGHERVKLVGDGTTTTGSATLTGKILHTGKSTCGKQHTKVAWRTYVGRYENGTTPFTVHPEIFKSLALRNGSKVYLQSRTRR